MEYDYYYDSTGGAELAGMFAIFAALAGAMLIASLISYIITSIALMLMFKKAGHPRAWGAWVPFYNTYLIFTFGGQRPLWFWIYLGTILVSAIPTIGQFVALIASIFIFIPTVYAYIFINKSFGKTENTALWTIFAVFLLPIWAFCLALGKSEYWRAETPVFMGDSIEPKGRPTPAW